MRRSSAIAPRFVVLVSLVLAAATLGLGPASAEPTYDQPVWFQWHKAGLRALIVPPVHGQLVNGNGVLNGGDPDELTLSNSYVQAIQDAIATWRVAIDAYGPSWLSQNLSVDVDVLGTDALAPLSSYDILFLTPERMPTFLGAATRLAPCGVLDSGRQTLVDATVGTPAQDALETVLEDTLDPIRESEPVAGTCDADAPCLALVNLVRETSFTYTDFFNVGGHEFGHCLGLDHSTRVDDLMDGFYYDFVGEAGNDFRCMSNLNVAGLELVFHEAILGTPAPSLVASMDAASYAQVACGPGLDASPPLPVAIVVHLLYCVLDRPLLPPSAPKTCLPPID